MAAFPQPGGCLCAEVEYRLEEDPLTVYACHCTDCQRQTGSSFSLSAVVRRAALRLVRGELAEYSIRMDDGRVKEARYCRRCATRLWGPGASAELAVLEAGTLADASSLAPVAHIWTRSRQPWLALPEAALRYEAQPGSEEWVELVRAWRSRPSA